jgi:HEAT repeats
MSFYPELDRLNQEELVVRFRMPPPEGEEYANAYYQEIAHSIGKKGKEGIVFLQQEIDNENPAKLQAILFALTENRLPHLELRDFLISYLTDPRPIIVMEAIDGLRRQGETETVNLVLALQQHSSPYVRSSVLRFMRQLYPDRALPLLIEGLKDPDFIVRENATDELGELEAVEALSHLRPLIQDPHPDVRQAAQTAIEILESVASDRELEISHNKR